MFMHMHNDACNVLRNAWMNERHVSVMVYLLHQGDLGFPPGQGLDLLGHALQLLRVEQHVAGPRGAHVNLQSDQLHETPCGSCLAKGQSVEPYAVHVSL